MACGGEWRPRREVGGYRLLEPLARSGLAMTFRAVGPESDASLAVKVLRPPFGFTQEDLERFSNDVRILAAYEHPHWLRIYDGGIEEDLAWLAMEWLPEGSLADLLAERGRLDEKAVLQFGAQAASALASAREAGLQHHNLHLTNCLLADEHTLKIAGFAEAHFYERAGEEVGALWGRLCCAPPERIFGDAEDARSEIYALGCILFQALAGALPYDGEIMPEIFYTRLGGSSLRLENFVSPIRKSTAEVIDRMLALGPGQRFQSWEETLESLTSALETADQSGSPVPVRPRVVAIARVAAKPPVYSAARGAWLTMLMLLAIVGIAGWFAWNHWHEPEPSSAPIAAAAPEASAIPEPPAAATPPATKPVVANVAAKPPPKVVATAPAPMPVVATSGTAEPPPPPLPKNEWSGWEMHTLKSPKPGHPVAQGQRQPGPGVREMRVSGNNTGIAGGHDECVFYARTLSGDWTLTARIVSNTGVAALCARAAIGSERSGQPCIAVILDRGEGKLKSAVRQESEKAVDVKPLTTASPPVWLQLTRRGTKLTARFAVKKDQWTPAAPLILADLPQSMDAGLMVWSVAKDAKETAAATFDEVTVSP